MSEKYLPIKIFEKRKDYDDRSTEGGGDSHEGSWVLHGEELNKRVDYLSKNVNTIQDSFQKWKENKRALPMIISTTVIDKAIAKTHRGRIVNLLENDGKDNVIGVYGDRQLLSMVTEESLLSTISQVIGRREDEATLISSISGIDVFSPFVEPYDSDNNVYRVRLCDYNDFDLNNMAKILFEQSCEAAGIKIHSKVRFTTDMTIYRVTIDNLEQLNAMGEFESVYSAEKTYPIMATMDILDSDNVVVVKQPEETEEYPVVGVLDTGIADIPYLAPWKEAVVHENYPKEYQDSVSYNADGIVEICNTSAENYNGLDIEIWNMDGEKIYTESVEKEKLLFAREDKYVNNEVEGEKVAEGILINSECLHWKYMFDLKEVINESGVYCVSITVHQDGKSAFLINSLSVENKEYIFAKDSMEKDY